MNKTLKRLDITFSETKAWLTLVGRKTLDSDLGIFIPNNATADKFAKQNGVKMNNNNGETEIGTNENKTNKDKNTTTYQVSTSRANPCKQGLS